MTMLSSLFRRSDKRRTYADLTRMDDRLLRDIGLSRSDLYLMMSGQRTSHGKGGRSHD